jgi:hypothetical protein
MDRVKMVEIAKIKSNTVAWRRAMFLGTWIVLNLIVDHVGSRHFVQTFEQTNKESMNCQVANILQRS